MQPAKPNKSRQLANELTRTHFTLGTSDSFKKPSVYATSFHQKAGGPVENQGEKLNLRASHFELGDAKTNPNFRTTNQRSFVSYGNVEIARLNDEKKKDLRTHHFSFGNYSHNTVSVNKASFEPKTSNIERQREEQEEAKNKMIRHNHDFTETQNKNYSSVYNSTFNKAIDPEALHQGLSGDQLKQKVVELRKSHVIFGGDQHPMKTVAMADYPPRTGEVLPPANDNVAIRKTNFVLGTNKGDYTTTHTDYYAEQPLPKDNYALFEALKTDLRAHHFQLGGDDANYLSNTMASFKKHTEYSAKPPTDPNLYQNHWTIGDEGAPLQARTSHSAAFKDYGPAQQNQARDQTQDRGSNWKLGTQSTPYVTENQRNFTKQENGVQVQDPHLKANLRASHFKFDDVKTNQFKSVSSQSYVPKKGEPGVLNEELKKDLRSHHFNYGKTNGIMMSSTQIAFKNTNGKPSNLDPALAKELRSHHFSLGQGGWQPSVTSEYRNNYPWAQPESS